MPLHAGLSQRICLVAIGGGRKSKAGIELATVPKVCYVCMSLDTLHYHRYIDRERKRIGYAIEAESSFEVQGITPRMNYGGDWWLWGPNDISRQPMKYGAPNGEGWPRPFTARKGRRIA